jgi:hypothetical protein
MPRFKQPFARDAGGNLTTDGTTSGPFACVGCGRTVVYRRQHDRRSRGATTVVRGHFMHVAADGGCDGESWIHRAAKAALVANPMHAMFYHCRLCSGAVQFGAIPTGDQRVEEYGVRCPDGTRLVLDVAVLVDDKLVGAIEVRHTHACDATKIHRLRDLLGDQWCEVAAGVVVDAVSSGEPMLVTTHAMCAVCRSEREHAELDELMNGYWGAD